jgi:hypothetical protein
MIDVHCASQKNIGNIKEDESLHAMFAMFLEFPTIISNLINFAIRVCLLVESIIRIRFDEATTMIGPH